MRLLVVIGDELLGGNKARDWAFLESLVAANGPESIEVEVVALINEPVQLFRFSNPWAAPWARVPPARIRGRSPTTPRTAPVSGSTAPGSTFARWASR